MTRHAARRIGREGPLYWLVLFVGLTRGILGSALGQRATCAMSSRPQGSSRR